MSHSLNSFLKCRKINDNHKKELHNLKKRNNKKKTEVCIN